MIEVKRIVEDIKNKKFKPLYILYGDEPYFIDEITNAIEENAIDEDSKDFNQTIMYGKEVEIENIITLARRYPVMSPFQLIIVKEAQLLSRTIDKITSYAENPSDTTILVFCYKYKKPDARKKYIKLFKKNGLVYESKKLYDYQVTQWVNQYSKQIGHPISTKAINMLYEKLGNDLERISNEINKLKIFLDEKEEITPSIIEKHIGISKDYNSFELKSALAKKEAKKAYSIANYLGSNAKSYPTLLILTTLNMFFTQLLIYHGLKDKSKTSVAQNLRINPFFVGEYQEASRNYPIKKVTPILSYILDSDKKLKGVGATQISPNDLLKELVFKILKT